MSKSRIFTLQICLLTLFAMLLSYEDQLLLFSRNRLLICSILSGPLIFYLIVSGFLISRLCLSVSESLDRGGGLVFNIH